MLLKSLPFFSNSNIAILCVSVHPLAKRTKLAKVGGKWKCGVPMPVPAAAVAVLFC